MDFYLMHAEMPVAVLTVAEKTGDIVDVSNILTPEHLPYGARNRDASCDVVSLRRWWAHRGIPASREGLQNALRLMEVPYPEMLLLKCNGLSLSDLYWVTSCVQPQSWHAVNFFENAFTEDVGRALFGEPVLSESANLCSPCNTSNGFLQKRWTIADGKRLLLKSGSGIYRQEPYNEVAASAVFERLGLEHVPYWLVKQADKTLSACECFVDLQTEFVSAAHMLQALPQEKGTSNWQHFVACMEHLGVPGAVEFTANMLAVDYVLANTDRHFGNFGALRNPYTLQWLGMAPVFDSGTSLWQMTITHAIDAQALVPAQPFQPTQKAQMELIAEFVTLQSEQLTGLGDVCAEMLKENPQFDADRAQAIGQAVAHRAELLQVRLAQENLNLSGFCELL